MVHFGQLSTNILPEELLLTDRLGEGAFALPGVAAVGTRISVVDFVSSEASVNTNCGESSQIASTRGKLYIDEALSNEEPS